ncbi:MAG: GIY-YIG nuclease family protein [Deltaproteobacteria bacterium]|nr:GIY-YIG nuclease family protein [Deltaproteobacteria bacterium]
MENKIVKNGIMGFTTSPTCPRTKVKTRQKCHACKKPFQDFKCPDCNVVADRYFLYISQTKQRIYSFNGRPLRHYEHAALLANALERIKPIYLYFLGFKHNDEYWTKIGISNNVKNRIRHLQIGSPFEIKLIAHVLGHPEMEKLLHKRFTYYRRRGEWFIGELVYNFAQDIKRGICMLPVTVENLEMGLGFFNVTSAKRGDSNS